MPYDPNSDFAKRRTCKRERHYAKFGLTCPDINTIKTKYVGIQGAYIDLMTPPEAYDGEVNKLAGECVAIYMPSHVVDKYQQLIHMSRFQMDSAGVTVDKTQSLLSMNCNYSTEGVPPPTIYHEQTGTDGDGNTVTSRVVFDYSCTIEDACIVYCVACHRGCHLRRVRLW